MKKTKTTKKLKAPRSSRRIPLDQYIDDGRGKVVTYDLVTKYHTKTQCDRFLRFMHGQTSTLLKSGVPGIYAGDYERWLRQGMKKEQGLDWD